MGKVKQLWQDEIDQAIEEYHDEVSLDFVMLQKLKNCKMLR